MQASSSPTLDLEKVSSGRFRRYFSSDVAKAFGLVYLAIALPSTQIWYENRDYFGFSAVEFIAAPIAVGLPVFLLLALGILFRLSHRLIKVSAAWFLTVGAMATFLVPSSFSVVDLNRVEDIESNPFSIYLLAATIFGLIPILFLVKAGERFPRTQRLGLGVGVFLVLFSVVFVAFSMVASGRLLVLTDAPRVAPLELSSQENVFLISFDQIQSTLFRQYLLDNPEVKEALPGFVLYEDSIAPYPNTNYSLASVYLGRVPIVSGESARAVAFDESSLVAELESSGWLVRAGGFPLTNNSNDFGKATFDWESPLEAVRHGVNKGFGLLIPNEYISFLAGREHTPSLSWKRDLEDFESALATASVFADKPAAHFYHLLGTHQPFSYDSNCVHQPLAQTSEMQNIPGALAVLECSVKLMTDFIEMLERDDIYESSTIIFYSDHGYEKNINMQLRDLESIPSGQRENLNNTGGPQNIKPLGAYLVFMMVKPSGVGMDGVGLGFSDFPSSLIDIAPTVCGQVGCKGEWSGTDLLSGHTPRESINRLRDFWLFEGALREPFDYHGSLDYNWVLRSFSGPAIDGLAQAMINYSPLPIGDGAGIDFSGQGNSSFYALEGWSGQEENHRWSEGPRAAIGFSLDSRPEQAVDVLVQLTGSGFIPPGGSAQKIPVSVNGFPLGILEVQELDTFDIRIPGDLFSDNQVRLDFDIPNVARPCEVSDSGDCRLLGLAVRSMSVSYIDSEESD